MARVASPSPAGAAVTDRAGIQRKIDNKQTHRVVVDMRGLRTRVGAVRDAIKAKPLQGVKEVMFYTEDGLSLPFRPGPERHMALEHHFYMDTDATRQEVRDVLVGAGIGFEARPDMPGGDEGLPDLSLASSPATSVTIYGNLERYSLRPDNGVLATLYVGFGDRRLYDVDPDNQMDFDEQTVQGAIALLRAFPDADAYLLGWDAQIPLLLRRGGALALSEDQTRAGEFWDPNRQALQALVDLPYRVEPLGPWPGVER